MMSTKRIALISATLLAIVIVISVVLLVPGIETSSNSGSLAVLITDPPNVPSGVSGVYMAYTNLQVHSSSAGNSSGWTTLGPSSGSVDLVGLVNSTRTIALSSVAAGSFNEIGFQISSVTVTYAGANYSSNIFHNSQSVTAQIGGGVQVSHGETSIALLDLSPTVLPLNNSKAKFEFIPQANGFQVAPSLLPTTVLKTDAQVQISGGTLAQIQQSGEMQIESAQLSPTSLSVTIKNVGSSPFVLSTLELSTFPGPSSGNTSGAIPATAVVAVFGVNSNASLSLLSANSVEQPLGYTLSSGSSVTLTFSGPITLQRFSVIDSNLPPEGVIAGNNYFVLVPSFTNGLSVVAQ